MQGAKLRIIETGYNIKLSYVWAFVQSTIYLAMETVIRSTNLTKSVPRTVCKFVSRILLHEKHVFSLQSLPDSWALHPPSGG